MLTPQQLDILQQANITWDTITPMELVHVINNPQLETLSTAKLCEVLMINNALYRAGQPLISDADYDFIFFAELTKREPQHKLLHRVEPEPVLKSKTIALPEKMLSTDKAYTLDDIKQWFVRVEKSAITLDKNIESLRFKITPKLDGYAAYDDGTKLYTRGDGTKGTDISRTFTRGLQVANQGKRGLGAGEIVISKTYFNQHLAADFDNSRNFQASIIKEKNLSPHAEQAIIAGAAIFFPFALLPAWQGDKTTLLSNFDTIINDSWHQTDYDVDGVVLEVIDNDLKQAMGATRHHHRWQIAYKKNLATALVKIISVTPQTSRTGRITPVAELEPVRLSGALLQRATVHHYQMVIDKGIGAGAMVKLSRSGEVIPKIEAVLTAVTPQIPSHCPSCQQSLIWESDFLLCPNHLHCPAQLTHTLIYFFKILANNDGFGAATIEKLHAQGIHYLHQIYALTVEEFKQFGFGDKQSINLVAQLSRSRHEAIEDWRFLAAFGLLRMGLGNCEKLLQQYSLQALFSLTEEQIILVEGFAEKTAHIVVKEFAKIKPLFDPLYALHFNLIITKLIESQAALLKGKNLVFTGKMQQGSRDEMKKQAKRLGAKVSHAISGKTDWLIMGENVGISKINTAKEKNVTLLTEQQYLQLLE